MPEYYYKYSGRYLPICESHGHASKVKYMYLGMQAGILEGVF